MEGDLLPSGPGSFTASWSIASGTGIAPAKLRRRIFFWEPGSNDADEQHAIDNIADPAGADGADDLQGAQLAGRLELALLQLPARQREVFELRVWEGLSVEETAEAMGCSAGSVKTHLSRALESLRKTVDPIE